MPLARTIVAARGNTVIVARAELGRRAEPVKPPERTLQAMLDELSSRVRRLTISARDPERFFVDRSEIAHELAKLAAAVR